MTDVVASPASPEIKGWCPGALRPMLSGDGWLVRIRPPDGTLTPAQAIGIAAAAIAHGNGMIDLSSRANLQLRGISEAAHPALIEDLRDLGLIDPDIATETARNLVITPFRDAATDRLAAALTRALAKAPMLPSKFGFAVDTGPAPILTTTSADIRIERSAIGALILRPDGHALGCPVTEASAVTKALALANWFLLNGGAPQGRGRMATLIAQGIQPGGMTAAPAAAAPIPAPGLHPQGALVAIAFGQMQANTLAALASLGHPLRLTPWRMILLSGATTLPQIEAAIIRATDPRLHVSACTGAPGCPQALGPTRALASNLAAHVPQGQHLHVSGCAKGCAHPGPAALTVLATATGYDLIRHGTAADAPNLTNISATDLARHVKAPNAAPL